MSQNANRLGVNTSVRQVSTSINSDSSNRRSINNSQTNGTDNERTSWFGLSSWLRTIFYKNPTTNTSNNGAGNERTSWFNISKNPHAGEHDSAVNVLEGKTEKDSQLLSQYYVKFIQKNNISAVKNNVIGYFQDLCYWYPIKMDLLKNAINHIQHAIQYDMIYPETQISICRQLELAGVPREKLIEVFNLLVVAGQHRNPGSGPGVLPSGGTSGTYNGYPIKLTATLTLIGRLWSSSENKGPTSHALRNMEQLSSNVIKQVISAKYCFLKCFQEEIVDISGDY